MTTITDALNVSSGTVLDGRSVGSGTWWGATSLGAIKGASGGASVELTSAIEARYVPVVTGTDPQDLASATVSAQIEFRMLGATTNRFCGLLLRYGTDHYLGRWYAGNLEIYRFNGGAYPLIASTALSLSTTTWYTLLFEVGNSSQRVSIGATSCSGTDSNISFSASANGTGFVLYSTTATAGTNTVQARNFTTTDVVIPASPALPRRRPRSLYTR